MKIKGFLKIIFVILFVASIISCNDDDEKSMDDFEIPILTEDNTIQFKVNAHVGDSYASYVTISANGRFAVDWGDGTVEKKANLEGAGTVYFYKSSGDFNIKIWGEELTLLNVSGVTGRLTELQVGSCPLMKDLILNSFHNTVSLDFSKCPNVETLNIGNYPDLETLNVSKCTKLKSLLCYTNPKLTSIDLNKELEDLNLNATALTALDLKENIALKRLSISGDTSFTSLDLTKNKELEELSLQATALTELSLKENVALKKISINVNAKLSSIEWTRMENLTDILLFHIPLTSFDATLFPALSTFFVQHNKFNTLDFSTNKNLNVLICTYNELVNLIISEDCHIDHLCCFSNKLEVDVLNTLFERLPISKIAATKMVGPPPALPSIIGFHDNPGADACAVEIMKDKGWKIL